MTAKEAKQRLERIWKAYTSAYDTVSTEDLVAFDMATNALGSIEQILSNAWKGKFVQIIKDLGAWDNMNNLISRQAALDCVTYDVEYTTECIKALPPAQPEIEEKLYQYKCYITDNEGLQHEVIHVGDIRRITGWEI